jgi:hypothetical protein
MHSEHFGAELRVSPNGETNASSSLSIPSQGSPSVGGAGMSRVAPGSRGDDEAFEVNQHAIGVGCDGKHGSQAACCAVYPVEDQIPRAVSLGSRASA